MTKSQKLSRVWEAGMNEFNKISGHIRALQVMLPLRWKDGPSQSRSEPLAVPIYTRYWRKTRRSDGSCLGNNTMTLTTDLQVQSSPSKTLGYHASTSEVRHAGGRIVHGAPKNLGTLFIYCKINDIGSVNHLLESAFC